MKIKIKITAGIVAALGLLLMTGCGSSSIKATEITPAKQDNQAVKEETQETSENQLMSETAQSDEEPGKSTDTQANKNIPVRVSALKGPTAMGMVKLMSDAEADIINGNSYEFTISGTIDEVTPALVQGNVDIAAVPANLSSVLYQNTSGKVQVLAVNTLGVLYLAEAGETVTTMEDLRGKTIYASGKGATPEYALQYILESNGLNPETDVTIEWKSEHSECVAALASKEGAIALLPQPFMTTAQLKNEKIRVAIDLNAEWNRLQETEETKSSLITGVLVVRTDFAKENPEAVSSFLQAYKESVDYVNANIEDSAALVEKYDIVTAAVAEKAIPYCNIVMIEGQEMKEKLSGYLSVLMEQNPKAIGGALPPDEFYYQR